MLRFGYLLAITCAHQLPSPLGAAATEARAMGDGAQVSAGDVAATPRGPRARQARDEVAGVEFSDGVPSGVESRMRTEERVDPGRGRR